MIDSYTIIVIISFALNLFLLYYSISAARKLYLVATNIGALNEIFMSFSTHVTAVHETEMFYGDETLKALIDHSKEVLDELDAYEDIMGLVIEEGDDGDTKEEEE
mgnify:CR=1 FL=1|tara:strand:- start:15 stop:329 length:315 start_codon:yes stop_codon:yes gene_type:complete